MKEDIEDLIAAYKRRIKSLSEMILVSNTEIGKTRLIAKKNVYKTVVLDLESLLKDEQDKT